jgi:hypothetical protein
MCVIEIFDKHWAGQLDRLGASSAGHCNANANANAINLRVTQDEMVGSPHAIMAQWGNNLLREAMAGSE